MKDHYDEKTSQYDHEEAMGGMWIAAVACVLFCAVSAAVIVLAANWMVR